MYDVFSLKTHLHYTKNFVKIKQRDIKNEKDVRKEKIKMNKCKVTFEDVRNNICEKLESIQDNICEKKKSGQCNNCKSQKFCDFILVWGGKYYDSKGHMKYEVFMEELSEIHDQIANGVTAEELKQVKKRLEDLKTLFEKSGHRSVDIEMQLEFVNDFLEYEGDELNV